jgi:hypothetical protein
MRSVKDDNEARVSKQTCGLALTPTAILATLALGALAGCAQAPVQPSTADAADACPDRVQSEVHLRASVAPREVPRELIVPEGVERHYAVLGRRISVAVAAQGAAQRLQILDSTFYITPYGGTFEGWATLNGTTAALDVIPGRLRVAPFLPPGRLTARTLTVDTIIQAGGAPLDQVTVTTSALWDDTHNPLPPDRVSVTLTPMRHFSAFGVVNAKLVLDFVARAPRAKQTWHCSAETQLVVVDRDAARPPLWDLGTSPKGRSRQLWLALFDPKRGPTRAIFTDPVAARGFAMWAQQTGATSVGGYGLGVFAQQSVEEPARIPADRRIMESYRPITPEDLAELKVGPLAEP